MIFKNKEQFEIADLDSLSFFKDYFLDYFTEKRIFNDELKTSEFYLFFDTSKFRKYYTKLITEICKKYKLDFKKICVQPTPTFRRFRPNAHGTSFHNDYLYGHGIESITVWVPLYGLDRKNSVLFLDKKYHHEFPNNKLAFNYDQTIERNLLRKSFSYELKKNQCYIFGAQQIHGSPKNTSEQLRYSFDFRISKIDDSTSSKPLSDYLYFKGKNWINKNNQFENKKFLKYVCGGKNKNTLSQQLLIESVSKELNINIVAQEAEIERFGFEIFKKNINGKIKGKEYNSIIIASKSIFNNEILKEISKSKVKVYSALEGKFLN